MFIIYTMEKLFQFLYYKKNGQFNVTVVNKLLINLLKMSFSSRLTQEQMN